MSASRSMQVRSERRDLGSGWRYGRSRSPQRGHADRLRETNHARGAKGPTHAQIGGQQLGARRAQRTGRAWRVRRRPGRASRIVLKAWIGADGRLARVQLQGLGGRLRSADHREAHTDTMLGLQAHGRVLQQEKHRYDGKSGEHPRRRRHLGLTRYSSVPENSQEGRIRGPLFLACAGPAERSVA